MSENPGECAYQHCTKPQSEHTYYLCETHYQQAWDNVLSRSPERNRKRALNKLRARRKPDGTWEFTPRTCSRGHYIDPTNITTQTKSGKICCRACNRARTRINREKITDPEAMNELADEIYREILEQIKKEAA